MMILSIQPIQVSTTNDAVAIILGFIGGACGFISMLTLIDGMLSYYVSTGDNVKRTKAMHEIFTSILIFIVSIISGLIGFLMIKGMIQ